jgi:RNA polymerase sigma-70 factor (ECF subfamily)
MNDDTKEEARVPTALAHSEQHETMSWLEVIYRENSSVVLQAAYRVTGNAEDAEDVLQTVFTRLARRTEQPDFSIGSRPYLRRAATNAALDIVQSRRVKDGVPLEVAGDGASRDPAPEPDRRHLGRELHDHLRSALTRISRRGAEIFALRYFEDFDNAEIAEMLGTSTNTVAVTLHRARTRLKEEMSPFLGGLQ